MDPSAPTPGLERHEGIDAVRGIAILGILLVNMQMFSEPIWTLMTAADRWPAPLDRAVHAAIQFLAQGKFYTLFSMLFGLGLAIQARRAEIRGTEIVPLFARRLGWLAAIGAVHAFAIWYGDILLTYAALGCVLLLFVRCRPRTLLIWSFALVMVPLAFFGLLGIAMGLAKVIGGEALAQMQEGIASSQTQAIRSIETSIEMYRTRAPAQVLQANARQWVQIVSSLFIFGPNILAMFLLGLYFGKRGIPHEMDAWYPRIRRALPWLATVGIAGNAVFVLAAHNSNPAVPGPLMLLSQAGFTIGAPTLALTYASIVLLAYRGASAAILRPLAAAGRMALTSYLTHSLVFVTAIVYLGYYGRVSPSVGLLLTLVMFGFQLAFSPWWLGRFRMGPVEWIWRSLTYGKPPPFRR